MTKKILSLFFFTIFLSKLVISTAPIYIDFSDNEHIINVIMQLEVEGKAQGSLDAAEKEIVTSGIYIIFNNSFLLTQQVVILLKNAGDIIAFFPSVPTPPPNY